MYVQVTWRGGGTTTVYATKPMSCLDPVSGPRCPAPLAIDRLILLSQTQTETMQNMNAINSTVIVSTKILFAVDVSRRREISIVFVPMRLCKYPTSDIQNRSPTTFPLHALPRPLPASPCISPTFASFSPLSQSKN